MRLVFINNVTNPLNSLNIQNQLLANIFKSEEYYECEFLNMEDKSEDIKNIKNEDILIVPYGGYTKYLGKYRKHKKSIFIFHNITPPQYFIFSDPLVSVLSIVGYLQLFLFRLIQSNVNWVAVSEYNMKILKQIGFKNITYIPNVLDTELKKSQSKSNKISLVYVGRIVENKNIIELVNQIDKVSIFLKEEIELIIVGTAKRNCRYEKKFKKTISRVNQNLKITLLSEVNQQELANIYRKAWIYVTMSLHEGFGLPACEAIANGTPALYLQCGGQESILGQNGMVFKSDRRLFHQIIINYIKNKAECKKLHEAQLILVKSILSPEINKYVLRRYNTIIGNLINA